MQLKEWMEREGYNQIDAAAVLGIDQGFLSRVLRGASCSADTMRTIADRTGGAVTPNDLVLGQTA